MKRAFKYRLLPNEEQAVLINKTVGCARFVYNGLLEDYKAQLDQGIKPVIKEATYLKQSNPFLCEVDSLALANAKMHLRDALKNFFDSRKGKRKGKKAGFPKKHKKSKCKWKYTTNNQGGTIRIDGRQIKLPKLGFVNFIMHRPLEGRITSCTIERTRDGKYYISVSVDMEDITTNAKIKDFKDIKVVGIDMSMKEFSVDSDNNAYEAKSKYVRLYRANERKLKRLQRRMSKKEKGSSNRWKAEQRFAKLERHVANCRLDFCHKLSKYYAENYDAIVLEDINLQDMSRTLKLGKSVMDLGFGMFRNMLSYKCADRDSIVMYIDKWYASSKICHECGAKNELLQLSDREWVCPNCGAIISRDLNASLNIRDYFYKVVSEERYCTAGTAGTYASGDAAATLRETLMQAASMNEEEAPSFRWG